jgi:hypothetical protein
MAFKLVRPLNRQFLDMIVEEKVENHKKERAAKKIR